MKARNIHLNGDQNKKKMYTTWDEIVLKKGFSQPAEMLNFFFVSVCFVYAFINCWEYIQRCVLLTFKRQYISTFGPVITHAAMHPHETSGQRLVFLRLLSMVEKTFYIPRTFFFNGLPVSRQPYLEQVTAIPLEPEEA